MLRFALLLAVLHGSHASLVPSWGESVYCGKAADPYLDSTLKMWQPWKFVSGATQKFYSTQTVNAINSERPLYASQCQGSNMQLSVGVPKQAQNGGSYIITIYSAELDKYAKPGDAVFDIYSEGRLQIANVDLAAQTGVGNVYVASFKVKRVIDFEVNLNFVSKTGCKPAKFTAVQIRGADGIDFNMNLWCGSGFFQRRATYEVFRPTTTVQAPIVRQSPGTIINGANNIVDIYRSECTGRAMTAKFPVRKGRYSVTIYNAEFEFTQVGQRKFWVAIEGKQMGTKPWDIVKSAGVKKVAKVVYVVDVADGILDVQFVPVAGFNKPKFAAITVLPVLKK